MVCVIHLCPLQLKIRLVHFREKWTPILTTILLYFLFCVQKSLTMQ